MKRNYALFLVTLFSIPSTFVISQIQDKTVTTLTTTVQENRCKCADLQINNSQAGIFYTVRNDANKIIASESIKGNGNSIVLNAGPISTTTTYQVIAQTFDKSLQFDGLNDYIETSTMVPFAAPFTITARIKTTYNGVIFGWTGSGSNNYASFEIYQGYLRYATGNGTIPNDYTDGASLLSNNVWQNVAVVNSGSEIKLYVNGNLEKTKAFTKIPTPNRTTIGGAYLNDFLQNFYVGKIDDLTIWNKALSSTEINNIITTNPIGNETNLLTYYNFNGLPDTALINKVSASQYYGKLNGIGESSFIIDEILDSLILTNKKTIFAYPNNTLAITLGEWCPGDPLPAVINNTNCNRDYFLRNDADNAVINGPVVGTGASVYFPSPILNTAATYNILMKETDQSLNFDGSSNYVEISPMIPLTDTITIMARIKSTDGSGTIFGWGQNDVNAFSILEIYASHLRFASGANSTTKVYVDGSIIINDNAWHHVAIVKTSKNVKLYVDGILDKTDAIIQNPIPIHSTIGAGFLNGLMQDYYAGAINDLSIWKSALTSQQIKCYATSKPWGGDKGLVALYNFNNLPSANLKNKASDTYHGTFTNMPTLSVNEPTLPEETQLSEKVTTGIGLGCPNSNKKINKIKDGINVFPIPTKGLIHIQSEISLANATISLVNTDGKEIYTCTTKCSNAQPLNLSKYNSGIYYLRIILPEKTIIRKIIKN